MLLIGNRLEDFTATALTVVGADRDDRLDVGNSGCDGADRDEVAQVLATDVTDSHGLGLVIGSLGTGLESQGVAARQFCGEALGSGRKIAVRDSHIHGLVVFFSPPHDNIENIFLEAFHMSVMYH